MNQTRSAAHESSVLTIIVQKQYYQNEVLNISSSLARDNFGFQLNTHTNLSKNHSMIGHVQFEFYLAIFCLSNFETKSNNCEDHQSNISVMLDLIWSDAFCEKYGI
jgi:hypothetical protein